MVKQGQGSTGDLKEVAKSEITPINNQEETISKSKEVSESNNPNEQPYVRKKPKDAPVILKEDILKKKSELNLEKYSVNVKRVDVNQDYEKRDASPSPKQKYINNNPTIEEKQLKRNSNSNILLPAIGGGMGGIRRQVDQPPVRNIKEYRSVEK